MKTIIVDVPNEDETLFKALAKKFSFKSRIVREEEKEEIAISKWIEEGMKSEDVPAETVYATFLIEKHWLVSLSWLACFY